MVVRRNGEVGVVQNGATKVYLMIQKLSVRCLMSEVLTRVDEGEK